MANAIEIVNGKEKAVSPDWRKTGFLWKPVAEHEHGVVIITLPIGKVKSVIAYNVKGEKLHTFKFRKHVGPETPAGDAWQDYANPGAWYPKNTVIKVTYSDSSVRTFKILNPKNRSDGK